ncbi:hypothetical protein [Campylobacter gastrosuis]|uniref:Uncharacterized protein n=1 Tax=Campylobacter gastrosuis TaxID=2974576 RepID=A0ABT7HTK2_9BACT|nr:hypothetical protein [Campylobacter gastrosuis]MDL0090077.1 hypothetical protein [Campylobacter gastrosuis]
MKNIISYWTDFEEIFADESGFRAIFGDYSHKGTAPKETRVGIYYDETETSDPSPTARSVIAPLKLSKQASKAFLLGLEIIKNENLKAKLEKLSSN